jgi:hypothetical protein
MRIAVAAAVSALSLALASSAALAFSDEPAPDGPGVQSQFNDPDAAVDNLADSAAGQNGTELSTGSQLPADLGTAQSLPAAPEDAEPVNPAWPAWTVWHQQ